MIRKCMGWTALLTVAMVGFAGADQIDPKKVAIPGTSYVVQPAAERPLTGAAMQSLLDAIETWLANEFGLPSAGGLPRIEIVPSARIEAMHYGRLLPHSGQTATVAASRSRGAIVAVYSDAARTIYLTEGWTGGTPAELSELVHEMVHHLQNVAGLRFACQQEREALAYRAQNWWLALFGSSLEQIYGLDGFSLLVKTQCAY